MAALVVRGVPGDRDRRLTAVSTLGTPGRLGAQRITTMTTAEGVSWPSMTELVQRLEQRGLVTQASGPAGGPVALVSLSTLGRAVLAGRGGARPGG